MRDCTPRDCPPFKLRHGFALATQPGRNKKKMIFAVPYRRRRMTNCAPHPPDSEVMLIRSTDRPNPKHRRILESAGMTVGRSSSGQMERPPADLIRAAVSKTNHPPPANSCALIGGTSGKRMFWNELKRAAGDLPNPVMNWSEQKSGKKLRQQLSRCGPVTRAMSINHRLVRTGSAHCNSNEFRATPVAIGYCGGQAPRVGRDGIDRSSNRTPQYPMALRLQSIEPIPSRVLSGATKKPARGMDAFRESSTLENCSLQSMVPAAVSDRPARLPGVSAKKSSPARAPFAAPGCLCWHVRKTPPRR